MRDAEKVCAGTIAEIAEGEHVKIIGENGNEYIIHWYDKKAEGEPGDTVTIFVRVVRQGCCTVLPKYSYTLDKGAVCAD